MQLIDCLLPLVGLSDTPCDCWDTDKPANFNESNSGQFIGDDFPLKWTNSASDCEQGGVWRILEKAREQAIRDVLAYFSQVVAEKNTELFKPFNDYIGQTKQSSNLPISGQFAAIRFCPARIRGGFWYIYEIELSLGGLTNGQTVDVFVYDSMDLTTPLQQEQITVTNVNGFNKVVLSTPLKIDLGAVVEDQEFFIVYQIPSGASIPNYKIEVGCGCSGNHNRVDQNRFIQFGQWSGIQANSIATLESPTSSNSYSNGLRIKSAISCDYCSWLCELASNPNDITNSLTLGNRLRLGMALADTIKAKAIAVLATRILKSKRINYYTMVQDNTELYKIRSKNEKNFKNGVAFLVSEMPEDVSDCLICKEDDRVQVGSIDL